MENKVSIPKYIAGLLLSGIISDTLLLESPTTTDVDRLVAKQLSKISGLDIKKYGLELLSSGVSIDGLTANEIIFKDFKVDGVSINSSDQVEFLSIMGNMKDKDDAASLYSSLDKMPKSIKKVVEPVMNIDKIKNIGNGWDIKNEKKKEIDPRLAKLTELLDDTGKE